MLEPEIPNLLVDFAPAWYELRTVQGSRLRIFIHRDAVRFIREQWTEDFAPEDFLAMVPTSPKGDAAWEAWDYYLPSSRTKLNAILRDQKGLAHLFALLYGFHACGNQTTWHSLQLLVVDNLLTKQTLHGSSLSVILTLTMCRWLKLQAQLGVVRLPRVEHTLWQAYNIMAPHKASKEEFAATVIGPKGFSLRIPPDGTDLIVSPEDNDDDSEGDSRYQLRGTWAKSHNFDGYQSPFTALMGLGTLHEMARLNLNVT